MQPPVERLIQKEELKHIKNVLAFNQIWKCLLTFCHSFLLCNVYKFRSLYFSLDMLDLNVWCPNQDMKRSDGVCKLLLQFLWGRIGTASNKLTSLVLLWKKDTKTYKTLNYIYGKCIIVSLKFGMFRPYYTVHLINKTISWCWLHKSSMFERKVHILPAFYTNK